MAKIAGTESIAKIISLTSIIIRATNKGVATILLFNFKKIYLRVTRLK